METKFKIGDVVQVGKMNKKFYFVEGREKSITPVPSQITRTSEIHEVTRIFKDENNAITYELNNCPGQKWTASMLDKVVSMRVEQARKSGEIIQREVSPNIWKRIKTYVTLRDCKVK